MNNTEIKEQLRYRSSRIRELIPLQTVNDAVNLLNAELNYVEAQIEYRERHGGMEGVVIEKP